MFSHALQLVPPLISINGLLAPPVCDVTELGDVGVNFCLKSSYDLAGNNVEYRLKHSPLTSMSSLLSRTGELAADFIR